MITATSFLDSPPSFDMLIITPLFWVEDILKTIKNVTQEKIYVNAIVDCTSLIKRNQYKTFEPVDLGSDEIIKMFYDKESRDQWRELIQAMKTRNIKSCFKRFHKEKDLKKLQYMEYSFLRSGDTVIEGGIFTGNTTSRFSNIVGMDGMVYAFDPLGTRYAEDTLGQKSNVEVISKALWNKNTELIVVDQGGQTVTYEVGSKVEYPGYKKIKSISIDNFIIQRGIDCLNFIKLDVEGAEPDVLAGARNTIEQLRPNLAISIYHTREQYFPIPIYLRDQLLDYVYILRCYSPYVQEAILYACPLERFKG